MEKQIKYKLEVVDEETGEVIYMDWAYSMESLEEKFFKIDHAVEKYKQDLERQDEGELTPEERQERSDGARESMLP